MPVAVNQSGEQSFYVDGREAPLGRVRQRSSEVLSFSIDYSGWLPVDETILSVTYLISPTTVPPLQESNPSIPGGDKALFQLSGGLENTAYSVLVTISTSGGQTKADEIHVVVGVPDSLQTINANNAAISAATSADEALASQVAAAASATAAATSATAAAASEPHALLAISKAAEAATSAATGVTAKNDAQTAAAAALVSENNAAASASAALVSENNAAASYNSLHNIYYGPLASNPTTRPDSSAMQTGDLYYNTTVFELRVRTASAWAAAALSPAGFLTSTNNLSDLANAANARTNLGLSAVAASGDASHLGTGTLPAARLPDPSAATLGGVKSLAAAANKWINSIGVDGLPTATRPATADLSDAGQANGAATLDGSGKVPVLQLPASVVGNVSHQGTWNANTNTPTIPAASSANKGYYYKVSVTGSTNIDGIADWKIDDWIVSNGTTWDKIDNQGLSATGALRFDVAQTLNESQRSQARANLYAAPANGVFYKKDVYSCAFVKTGAGTVSIKAGSIIDAAGVILTWAADTAVTMPSLTGGTDYAIYACADGALVASSSFTAPAGYTTANSRQIGGFHYAPGGNATANSGGDTTPAINQYSLWDLKWRPACLDPRGMTLVAGGFWCDIYLLGVDHQINGTSKNNVTIADGSSPPKLPAAFGGNGTTTYSTLTVIEAQEVLRAYGKRLLSYDQFAAAAFGTTEAISRGADAVTTGLNTTNANQDERFTSKWGVVQSSGVMGTFGANFGGGAAAAGWVSNVGGRGKTYQVENIVLFGGPWVDGVNAGSRGANWVVTITTSDQYWGARGCCDHLMLV